MYFFSFLQIPSTVPAFGAILVIVTVVFESWRKSKLRRLEQELPEEEDDDNESLRRGGYFDDSDAMSLSLH